MTEPLPVPLDYASDGPLPPEALTAAARLLLAIVRRERAELAYHKARAKERQKAGGKAAPFNCRRHCDSRLL